MAQQQQHTNNDVVVFPGCSAFPTYSSRRRSSSPLLLHVNQRAALTCKRSNSNAEDLPRPLHKGILWYIVCELSPRYPRTPPQKSTLNIFVPFSFPSFYRNFRRILNQSFHQLSRWLNTFFLNLLLNENNKKSNQAISFFLPYICRSDVNKIISMLLLRSITTSWATGPISNEVASFFEWIISEISKFLLRDIRGCFFRQKNDIRSRRNRNGMAKTQNNSLLKLFRCSFFEYLVYRWNE